MNDIRPRMFPSTAAKVAGVMAVVCALALGGVLGIVFHKNDDKVATAKVVLEPITKVARDAWVDGADTTDDPASTGSQYGDFVAGADTPDGRSTQTYATLAGQTVDGDSAGIYGGGRDQQVCDKSTLVDVLSDPSNADTATKWAASLGITAGQITNYIQGLTGARLRWDTRVTDSGINNGAVTTWQALLQAGTAVLVDNTGVPRIKCNSGSPLLSPEGLRSSTNEDLDLHQIAQNPEDAWPNLDPRDAVTVQPGRHALETVTIVDIDNDNDELLQRDIGSDGQSSRDVGTGDVQFNLKWAEPVDLDLHVIAPDGTTFGYREDYYRSSAPDGGEHDVDFLCSSDLDQSGFAQENVFWPNGGAPAGDYRVFVRGWSLCNRADAVPFTLTVTINGTTTQYSAAVTDSGGHRDSQTWTFTKN